MVSGIWQRQYKGRGEAINASPYYKGLAKHSGGGFLAAQARPGPCEVEEMLPRLQGTDVKA